MKEDQSSGDEGQRGCVGLGAGDKASRRLHQPVAFPMGGSSPRPQLREGAQRSSDPVRARPRPSLYDCCVPGAGSHAQPSWDIRVLD